MRASNEKIIIIDFGSPMNKVLTRKIRELNVYSKLVPPSITAEEIKNMRPNGIVLGASPESVYTNKSPKPDPKIFELDVPILGVCYGLQLITQFYGGVVDDTKQNEFGIVEVKADSRNKLFNGLPVYNTAHMRHGDRVKEAPPGFFFLLIHRAVRLLPLALRKNRFLVFNSIPKWKQLKTVMIFYGIFYMIYVDVTVNGR
ncbi:hypothetical protein KC820_09300 [Allobacillus sp. SKP8-2]|uniref:Glutamine amidotransferase n=1 Tax=Allobacillus saliphilus TaxID=2912308 RepID=A0A941HUG6_9BACI|nr:hypothetical protein [uncultured Allobacillus sp.]MBR7554349.1 hypothetical protein [Allobacillus saliphilus]